MPISQNTGLFSLLGTMYGGDGKSNFVLPNVFWDQESGLSLYDEGQQGGAETVALLQTEMPIHARQASGASGNGPISPANNTWGAGAAGRTPPPTYVNGSTMYPWPE